MWALLSVAKSGFVTSPSQSRNTDFAHCFQAAARPVTLEKGLHSTLSDCLRPVLGGKIFSCPGKNFIVCGQ